MHLSFDNERLKECANNSRAAKKYLGKHADAFRRRLDTLASAITLEDVRNVPGHFHELSGDRKGQLACRVSANHRLIFKPTQQPVPIKPDGGFDWSRITSITLVEIEDYH